ncbi:MAG: glycosyltransferase family 2 protein [Nocardioidaceae bacterium]
MTRTVGVVVVTHNSESVVDGVLDSVAAAMDGHAHLVTVVDNGSTDDTVDRVRLHHGVAVLEQANRGYSAGINAGVAALPSADVILVLNPDVRLEAGSVVAMLSVLDDPNVGVVAPRLLDPDGTIAHSLRRAPTLARAMGLSFTRRPTFSEAVTEPAAYQVRHPVDWATGAVLLIRRECHEALGGWDESYFLYSEETDFCLRAADAGWRTEFEPAASALHIGGASGRSGRTHTIQTLNRVRLYARRHGRRAGLVYLGFMTASQAVKAVRGRPESREALVALIRPRRRPVELGAGVSLIPR